MDAIHESWFDRYDFHVSGIDQNGDRHVFLTSGRDRASGMALSMSERLQDVKIFESPIVCRHLREQRAQRD